MWDKQVGHKGWLIEKGSAYQSYQSQMVPFPQKNRSTPWGETPQWFRDFHSSTGWLVDLG